jgi:hypothetical protein
MLQVRFRSFVARIDFPENVQKRFINLAYKMLQVRFRSFVARIAVPENVHNCLGKMATNGDAVFSKGGGFVRG